MTIMVLF